MHAAEIDLALSSELKNVPLAAGVVRAFCEFARLPPAAMAQVELALVEAVNNVIAHGCPGRTDARIGIRLRVRGDALVIELRDPGIPLPALPGAAMPDSPAECGRGWPLIHACVDRVEYRSEDGSNVLTLGKNLAG
jgi:serine/threonine-protein kinase RsbW